MFTILKALRMIILGLFKFSHGMNATGTKYWDMISFCLDIPESLTYCPICWQEHQLCGL